MGEQTGEGEGAVEDPKKAQLKAMFKKLAGADGEVDGEELQDLLTATLASDLGHSVFSLEACRSMITMLDVSFSSLPVSLSSLLPLLPLLSPISSLLSPSPLSSLSSPFPRPLLRVCRLHKLVQCFDRKTFVNFVSWH